MNIEKLINSTPGSVQKNSGHQLSVDQSLHDGPIAEQVTFQPRWSLWYRFLQQREQIVSVLLFVTSYRPLAFVGAQLFHACRPLWLLLQGDGAHPSPMKEHKHVGHQQ